MIQKFNGFGMQESVEEIKKSAKKLYPSVSLLIKDILEGNIK